MKYKLSHKAIIDLANIWHYTNTTWNFEQADTYLDTLHNRFLWLTQNQSLWFERADIHEGLYGYHESSHVIFFRSYADGIEIVRVLHERMNMKQHL